MNNQTTEDLCSFDICKLLKDKGFDCAVFDVYSISDKSFYELTNEAAHKRNRFNSTHGPNAASVPTHALAIKWIYENFDIFISNVRNKDKTFAPLIYLPDDNEELLLRHLPIKECTEAALFYTLTNLIP